MLRICSALVLVWFATLAAADISGPVRVIDGDTFDIGDTRVRLFGIDAPETDQHCVTEQGVAWACGDWVNTQVRQRYQGRQAVCRARDRDRYGRVVASCTVDGQDVGRALVADGLAFAYRRYAMDYDLDEKGAAVNDRGLWASAVQSPAQFRRTRVKGRIPPDRDCVIKGNVSSKGVRIYHVPGQRDYDRTGINTARGERWFCTAAEARAAGWRAARN